MFVLCRAALVSRFGLKVNPFIVQVARRVWPLAVVRHVGRRTGRASQTPVMAFPTSGGWVVALLYGADVRWLRNAQRAGAALTRAGHGTRSRRSASSAPRRGRRPIPAWARAVLGPARVRDYVLLVASD